MTWILMKNNMKLMLRSRWIILLMMIVPVFVVAMLSSAFKEILGSYEMDDTIRAGYTISSDSMYNEALQEFSKSAGENGLLLLKIDTQNIEETMQEEELVAFLEVTDTGYILYTSADYSKQARVIREVVNQFFYQIENYKVIVQTEQPSTKITEVEVTPLPSAEDYYGIIEIVYFSMCGIVSLAVVIASERKNQITRRIRVAQVGCFQQILAKLVPCTIAVFVESTLGAAISILLIGNRWGNLFKSAGILLLISFLATALGLFTLELFKNVAVSIITTFAYVWFMGFYGGSFENYMQADTSEYLKRLSPLYYANRTLVEYRTMGSSTYTIPCILFLLGLSVVLIFLTIQCMKLRREG